MTGISLALQSNQRRAMSRLVLTCVLSVRAMSKAVLPYMLSLRAMMQVSSEQELRTVKAVLESQMAALKATADKEKEALTTALQRESDTSRLTIKVCSPAQVQCGVFYQGLQTGAADQCGVWLMC